MYNKILIISDNLNLAQKFNALIEDLNIKNVDWYFAVSHLSDKFKFAKKLKRTIESYNLKEDNDINEIINNFKLVISVHSKQLFPNKMVNKVKCINVHPGYNPINRGWYPQVFAIINNQPIGATIHEIDQRLDHGPIIARKFVEKTLLDTSETLYNRVVEAEMELLNSHLITIINGNYNTYLPENEGTLYLKQDFDDLCELDLEEKLTALQFINKLRALTHGDFNNAYFIDPKTNKKIYISVNLKEGK